jgi:hypothetical protein
MNSYEQTLAETAKKAFPTYEAMRAAADKLVAEGWTKLPADLPTHGVIGYMCFRQVGDQEEVASFEWMPFGFVVPNVVEVGCYRPTRNHTLMERKTDAEVTSDVAQALDALEGKKLYRADDPMRRLVGFVYYEAGKANVTQISLTASKEAGLDRIRALREATLDLRATVVPAS